MKRALTRTADAHLYHYVDEKQIDGVHDRIRGEVSGISGNVSGIRGNVSEIRGSVDDCDLTDADRAAGVDVADLIAETAAEAAE